MQLERNTVRGERQTERGQREETGREKSERVSSTHP
jgi:hypothetical protein